MDDQVANAIMAPFAPRERGPEQDINLYINSPGGSVSAGLAIYDTMQFVKPDIVTTALGMAASMGAFLLAAGAKGRGTRCPTRGYCCTSRASAVSPGRLLTWRSTPRS